MQFPRPECNSRVNAVRPQRNSLPSNDSLLSNKKTAPCGAAFLVGNM